MYQNIEDQEKHPEKYELKKMSPDMTEDECFNLISKPRQTQKTVGLYLKKIKGTDDIYSEKEVQEENLEKKRISLTPGNDDLERRVRRNKGFWVDRPERVAPLIWKLREKYTVDIKKKTKREQGIFYRSKFLELDYLMKMAKAGLSFSEEDSSESEEEIQPDETNCLPLRKTKYKICDPCKEKKEKKEKKEEPPKDLIEKMRRKGIKPPFQKILFGCQCDFFGDHNKRPTVWDNPFENEIDMLRQHEMNKVLKPYKHEFLNSNYETPVKFMAHEPGMKRTFPVYQISNLSGKKRSKAHERKIKRNKLPSEAINYSSRKLINGAEPQAMCPFKAGYFG